jgi:hypothetical protein
MVIAHGRLYGIELKIKGGVLSRRNRADAAESPRILSARSSASPTRGHGDDAIARSVDEVLDQLAAWRVPLRGR